MSSLPARFSLPAKQRAALCPPEEHSARPAPAANPLPALSAQSSRSCPAALSVGSVPGQSPWQTCKQVGSVCLRERNSSGVSPGRTAPDGQPRHSNPCRQTPGCQEIDPAAVGGLADCLHNLCELWADGSCQAPAGLAGLQQALHSGLDPSDMQDAGPGCLRRAPQEADELLRLQHLHSRAV